MLTSSNTTCSIPEERIEGLQYEDVFTQQKSIQIVHEIHFYHLAVNSVGLHISVGMYSTIFLRIHIMLKYKSSANMEYPFDVT